MSQKRFCIVRHYYYPLDTRERRHIAALREDGWAIDIICLRDKGEQACEYLHGARVIRIPLRHKRSTIISYLIEYVLSFIMMMGTVSYLHWKNRYDCIQVCTMPDFLVFTTILPKLMGARVLLDVHEPTPELWVTKFGEGHLHLLYLMQVKILQLALHYADGVITVTRALRERLGEMGVPMDKIEVVGNVCNEVEFIVPESSDGRGSPRYTVFMHGLMDERAGHKLVIKALCMLRDRIPEMKLDIVGFGEYEPALKEFVRESKCEDRVTFYGFLPFTELLKMLAQADLGVIPLLRSPYSELIDTNKMYEYISLKIPLIISRLRPVESQFDESSVMYFQPGDSDQLADCILDLYRNRDKARRLAANAYAQMKENGWPKHKRAYVSMLGTLMRQGS